MLITEWNMDDALAVAREEAYEDGIEEGKLTIARNLLAMGIPIVQVVEGTGLDLDALKELQADL